VAHGGAVCRSGGAAQERLYLLMALLFADGVVVVVIASAAASFEVGQRSRQIVDRSNVDPLTPVADPDRPIGMGTHLSSRPPPSQSRVGASSVDRRSQLEGNRQRRKGTLPSAHFSPFLHLPFFPSASP